MTLRTPCLTLLLVLATSCQPAARPAGAPPPPPSADAPDPPAEAPAAGEVKLRTTYVPAYSHVPGGNRAADDELMAVLLSVRNVDSRAEVKLTQVDYFDTSGHRVRRYLATPQVLRPLETADFAVDTYDRTGGSGANFLVYWEAPSDVHPLLTETIMMSRGGSTRVAFTSRGVELDRRPDPKSFASEPPATTAPDRK